MSVSSGSTDPIGPTTFVASGSEGCVVKPAFPNNDGPHERNVAKIFFRKKNAKNALNRNAQLGSIGIEPSMFPYTRTFKGRNVPGPFRERCRVVSDEQDLGVVRMPNLGVDFFTLLEEPSLVAQIQRLPLSAVLENGVLRLFQTILKLRKAGVIHFDVRFENVMLDPTTGTFTLIDYGRIINDKDIVNRTIAKHLYDRFPPEMILWLSSEYELYRRRYEQVKDKVEADAAAAAEEGLPQDEIEAAEAAEAAGAREETLALAKQQFTLDIRNNALQRDQWLNLLYEKGRLYKDLNEENKGKLQAAFAPSCELWTSIYPDLVNNIEKHGQSDVVTALTQITGLNTINKNELAGRVFEVLFDPAIVSFIEKGATTREGLMASFKRQSINTIDSYGAALCVLMFFNKYFANSVNWLNCPTDVKNALYMDILIPMIDINYEHRVGIDDETITKLNSLIERMKEHKRGFSSSSSSFSAAAPSSAATTLLERATSRGGRRTKKLKSRRRCPSKRRRTQRK